MNAVDALVTGHAGLHPEDVALLFEDGSVTYGQLGELVNRAAGVLRSAGCRRGDRVIVAVPDSLDAVVAILGALAAGAVAVPVGGDVGDRCSRYLADTRPAVLVASEAVLRCLSVADTGATRVIVADGAQGEWKTLLERHEGDTHVATVESADPAVILYTSGSTGTQKGLVHSHSNIVTASSAVGEGLFGLGRSDIVLSTSRLSFAFGFSFALCIPLKIGASSIIDSRRAQLDGCVDLARRWRPSVLCAVPTFLSALSAALESIALAERSSIRFVVSAGEPLPVELYDRYRAAFGLEILDGIGSTELFSHFMSNRPGASRRGSCGVPAPDCEVRLVDEAGQMVGPGEVGSLQVKTGRAFVSHVGVSRRTDSDGWVGTGDKLYRDEAGHFHFCGREDDMLKVSGQWVSPLEVESTLNTHPAVRCAAVTVRGDGRGSRRLVAYVERRPGHSVTSMSLLKHAGATLPGHMLPSAFVVLDELPKTPNGKLNRAALPAPQWGRA